MDVVPVVVSADEGGDDVTRIEVDPGEKSCAKKAVCMRRWNSWRCILIK